MRTCAIRIAVACAKVKNKMVENWLQMVERIASIYFVILTGAGTYYFASSRRTVSGEKAGTQTAMYSAPSASGVL